jgi:hypothetical protein
MVVRVVGFDPQCDPAQPSLARPGPARLARSQCPTPPHAPLLLSLSHLDFPRSNLSLPLPSLSPRGALGLGDGDHQNLDPEVSSPPFSSLSPSLPLPPLSPCAHPLFSPLCARVPARRRDTPPRPAPSLSGAGAAPPLRSPAGAAPPLPSPAALGPSPSLPVRRGPSPPRRRSAPPLPFLVWRGPCAERGLGAGARAWPRPSATRLRPLRAASTPPARGRSSPVAWRPTLGLVSFKISLMSALRRALCRATIQFKFVFINVLRRALRRATIQFKFVFINVLRRTLRRATILLVYIH